MWNPAAERIFGWAEGEVLGRPLPTIPDEILGGVRRGAGDLATGRSPRGPRDAAAAGKDGSVIEVSLWTAPLYDARGEPCGRMGVIEDITERKRAEEARHGPAAADRHGPGGGAAADRPRAARPDGPAPRGAEARAGGARWSTSTNPDAAEAAAAAARPRPAGSARTCTGSPWSCGPTALDDWGLPTALSNYADEWSGARRGPGPVPAASGSTADRLPPAGRDDPLPGRAGGADQRRQARRAGRVSLIVERRRRPRARHRRGRRPGLRRRGGDGPRRTAERRLGLLGMQERVGRSAGDARGRVQPRRRHDRVRPHPAAGRADEAADHG